MKATSSRWTELVPRFVLQKSSVVLGMQITEMCLNECSQAGDRRNPMKKQQRSASVWIAFGRLAVACARACSVPSVAQAGNGTNGDADRYQDQSQDRSRNSAREKSRAELAAEEWV